MRRTGGRERQAQRDVPFAAAGLIGWEDPGVTGGDVRPIFYARPSGERLSLNARPRLASWNATSHPDQVRLRVALEDARALLHPSITSTAGPLALAVDVGLPVNVPLLDEHDLDNYAFPMAAHLSRSESRPFAAVWCSKRHGPASFVGVGPAEPVATPVGALNSVDVDTTASASTPEYKQEIADQLASFEQLPEGPVSLELAFAVGPSRNWLNLWKPTIDSLESLLGRTGPDRSWHPRDGRIVDLGLHCIVDSELQNRVAITIWAVSLPRA